MIPLHEVSIYTLLRMAFVWQLLSFAVYLVGLLAIATFFFDNFKSVVLIVKSILEPYFQPQLPQTLVEKFGKWAVITGSTDGIGREYAKELAKQGINVVLISRTKEKLIAVAEEIENEFKVKTKWIVADFSKGREVYTHIERELSGIPVGILVNNVGKMYDYLDELSNIPEDTIWDLININVAAVTIMSRMLIPELKKQKRGAIVNISSGSELQPIPYMAVYAATKRYVRCFSQAIERELAEHNITVQCVTPLFLVTKMNQYSDTVMKGGFLIPDVKSFTRSAVFTLGKSAETTGYWTHGLQKWILMVCRQFRMGYQAGGETVSAPSEGPPAARHRVSCPPQESTSLPQSVPLPQNSHAAIMEKLDAIQNAVANVASQMTAVVNRLDSVERQLSLANQFQNSIERTQATSRSNDSFPAALQRSVTVSIVDMEIEELRPLIPMSTVEQVQAVEELL